jgi:hypothetical protein
MLVGPHVVCLKTRILEQDPAWSALRLTGISEVFHMPSVPAGIAESDLHTENLISEPSANHTPQRTAPAVAELGDVMQFNKSTGEKMNYNNRHALIGENSCL